VGSSFLDNGVGSSLLLVPRAQVLVMRADSKIPLQRRSDNGVWEIPAGSCEPGQSFRTAASNELFEETGIDASPESLVAFASFSDPAEHLLTYPNGDQAHAFALCCYLQLTSDVEPKCSDGEVSEFRWVSPGACGRSTSRPNRSSRCTPNGSSRCTRTTPRRDRSRRCKAPVDRSSTDADDLKEVLESNKI
jgi:8-oxo-dGTP pyrophosphatase MutT (NUDIX family)